MIAGYLRVSSEGQREGYSLTVQRERAEEFARQINDDIMFYEEVKSAKNINERQEFQRLIEDVKAGKISKVWAIEQTRLTRDVADSDFIRKLFKTYKIILYVNGVPRDFSKSSDRMIDGIQSVVGANERESTGERVKRSKDYAKTNGLATFSCLYGYTRTFTPDGKSSWIIDDKEAEIVRKIFKLYSDGKSYALIARALNDNVIKTKKGREWTAVTVAKLLSHPEYYGKTKNLEGELIDCKAYAPILDLTAPKMLATQHKKRETSYFHFRYSNSLLSGLLRCGGCGAHYYIYSSQYINAKFEKVIYVRYAHKADKQQHRDCPKKPKYIRKEPLEKIVSLLYYIVFSDEEEVGKFLKKKKTMIFKEQEEVAEQIELLNKRMEKIEARRGELIDGVASGIYTNGDIEGQMKKLNTEKAQIQSQIFSLSADVTDRVAEYEAYLRTYTVDHLAEFSRSPDAVQRNFYKEAIEEFSSDEDMITLRFITGAEFKFSSLALDEYLAELGKKNVKKITSKVLKNSGILEIK